MWPWRVRRDEDFAEEIQTHIAHETKRLVEEEGLSVADAKARALRSFGNTTRTQENFHDDRRVPWLDDFRQDTTYAARTIKRNPAFAAIAIATLALGVGANTAIFSVVNAVLLEPLPYVAPDRVVRLSEITPAAATKDGRERRSGAITLAEMLEIRTHAKSVTHAAFGGGPAIMTFSGGGESRRLQGQRVAPGLFDTLGVRPLLGRNLGALEEQPDAGNTIVLSYDAWQRHFNGDPRVVGQIRTLADVLVRNAKPGPYTIVGVMPEEFEYPDRQIEFWIPVPWRPSARGSMIARLSEGTSLLTAQTEIGTILRELRQARPDVAYELTPVTARPEADDLRPALTMLMAAAGFVLLIAGANVANLLFARSVARQRETAVRMAIGAARGRLIRQQLTESLLLASLGGLLGVLLALGGVRALKELATTLGRMDLGVQLAFPRLKQVDVDPTVLAFAFLLSVIIGALSGLAPAIRQSRPQQMKALREMMHGRPGYVMVTAEISAATILLVGAGLLMHSFVKLSSVNLGYEPDNVLTFQVALPPVGDDKRRLIAFADALTERLRSEPGVQASAYGQLPLVALTESARFRKTPPVPKTVSDVGPERRLISRDYFRVMGIQVIAGRGFTDRDRAGQPRVVIINQVLARREFHGQNPIGRHVYVGPDSHPWEIIGVVEDVRQGGLDAEPTPQVFVEHSQWPDEMPFVLGPYFSVRTVANPIALAPQIQRIARQLDSEAGLFNVATMEELVSNRTARPRMYTVLLSLFAGVAVVLAAVGVYGVTAYAVTCRIREIGVRVALGARHGQIIRLVLRQGVAAIGIGVIAGLAGAAALTKYLHGMLFGVTPLDLWTFATVAVFFVCVAVSAALIPTRRALRIEPLQALRYE